MTENKRFVETISTGIITDTVTGKEYNCEYRVSDEFLELINTIADENEQLKEENKKFKLKINTYHEGNKTLHQTLQKYWEGRYNE